MRVRLWASGTIFVALVVALVYVPLRQPAGVSFFAWVAVGTPLLLYSGLGFFILRRQPQNNVGLLISATALLIAVMFFSSVVSDDMINRRTGPIGVAAFLQWINSWVWAAAFGSFGLLPLLFPTGRLHSRRWRPAIWTISASVGMVFLASFLSPWRGDFVKTGGLVNPFPFQLPLAVTEVMAFGASVGVMTATFAGFASIFFRYRRSVGAERLQLKWVAFTTVIALITFGLQSYVSIRYQREDLLFLTLLIFLSGIAIAMLRYRLYEIDRIIHLSLVYGVVTAILFAMYLGIIVALQSLLGAILGGSDLAIAGTTLAVAAAFSPVRRIIQTVVDRRFFRRRYDAGLAIDAFSHRLRRQVDLQTISRDLRGVVASTMQPAHLSIWLPAQQISPNPGERRGFRNDSKTMTA